LPKIPPKIDEKVLLDAEPIIATFFKKIAPGVPQHQLPENENLYSEK